MPPSLISKIHLWRDKSFREYHLPTYSVNENHMNYEIFIIFGHGFRLFGEM